MDAQLPLSELLPHAEPMVLVSAYEPWSGGETVTAFADVTPASAFHDVGLGGVPSCVALEYMAQTMALLVGLTRRKRGLAPQIGFVLGSRRLETSVPVFRSGVRYRITATCTYEDDSFGSFDCAILDPEGAVVAKGTLTAFQPSPQSKLDDRDLDRGPRAGRQDDPHRALLKTVHEHASR